MRHLEEVFHRLQAVTGGAGTTYTGWHFTEAQHHGRDGWTLQKVEELPTGTQPILCEVGLHASKSALDALSYAPGSFVSQVRLEGTVVVGGDKACATRRVRLAGPADASRELRLFAADCAEHVLPIFEQQCPGDDRPRKAIEVARRFADGDASQEELRAASESAADSVSESAADSVVWAAAWAASESAAWAASGSASESAGAAWAASGAASGGAEFEWQERRLQQRLTEAIHRSEMRQQLTDQ